MLVFIGVVNLRDYKKKRYIKFHFVVYFEIKKFLFMKFMMGALHYSEAFR